MPAKSGDTVRVQYKGTLEDGAIFDESQEGQPLEVTLGQQQLIEGVENAIIGMEIGDEKTETIAPEQAYGPLQDGLAAEVERSQLPADVELKTGMIMEIRSQDGKTSMNVTITDVKEDKVTIDANHPLAGKTLIFELKLLEIV